MTHTDMRLEQISIEKFKFTVIAYGVATGDKGGTPPLPIQNGPLWFMQIQSIFYKG